MGMKSIIILVNLLCWIQSGHLQSSNQRKHGNGKLLDLITRCCEHGIKAAKSNVNVDCQRINAPMGFLRMCRPITSLCCTKQLQESMCIKGTEYAKTHAKCPASGLLGSDKDECCNCCHLGMEARDTKQSCRLSMLGNPCDQAFRQCCLSSDPLPTAGPGDTYGPTGSTVQPTIQRLTCNDINCAQTCSIIGNVPTCGCRTGFKLASDKTKCNDVNECNQPDACLGVSEKCVNTYGSYKCTKQAQKLDCPTGFEVHPSGTQCQDINECRQSVCKYGETCKNKPGSYECAAICPPSYIYRNGNCEQICRSGYQWDGTARICKDVDECLNNNICGSNQICKNVPGSYRCTRGVRSCPASHYLRNGVCHPRCSAGEEWDSTNQRCKGNTRCQTGYQYDSNSRTCKDVNECLKRGICGTNKDCVNVPGTYRCNPKCSAGYYVRDGKCQRRCSAGYEWDENRRTCKDTNECLRRGICQPDENCYNRRGTYLCRPKCLAPLVFTNGKCQRKCGAGYKWNQGTRKCEDVDECQRNPCQGSDEVCVNSEGTYSCNRCKYGTRKVNGKCEDINECDNPVTCSSDERCVNTDGSYRCDVICPQGYESIGNPPTQCRDIDECSKNPCASDEVCQNTQGSFQCSQRSCQPGYRLSNRQCRDINECEEGSNRCAQGQLCENAPGSYRCRNCPNGLEAKNGVCEDVDECRKYNGRLCNHKCVNTYGSYYCECRQGYKLQQNNRTCRDFDECRENRDCSRNGYCVNTPGSYRCQCNEGYKLSGDGRTCRDVDECATSGGRYCQHTCTNSDGSFRCSCKPGYILLNDRRSCKDIDECLTPNRCEWRCQNQPGSFKCYCPTGYEMISGRCKDIDECKRRRCGSRACHNTYGSYKCVDTSCPNEYFIRRDAGQCVRKQCGSNEKLCLNEKRKSIRWYGSAFPNNVAAGSFKYTYDITIRGYRVRPIIRYYIESGDVDNLFRIRNTGYGSMSLENIATFRGPKEYKLKLVGEVVSEGEVTAQFISNLHIYISRYQFV